MEPELVGYVLNSLDEETRRAVEDHLAASPEARQRLERVRAVLAPLAADKEDPQPPADLVYRTLGRVAQQCTRELPRAPTPTRRSFGTMLSGWRRADVVVAACLVVVVGGLTVLAVGQLRQTAARTSCQENLRTFHVALEQYHDKYTNYPDVRDPKNLPKISDYHTRAVAGMVVPLLIKAGYLDKTTNIRCPGNGSPQPCPVHFEDLQHMSEADFQQQAPTLSGCYAYCLGYLDEQKNTYQCPKHPEAGRATLPLMADCPPPGAKSGNSFNHAGTGQNVLFHDGHVAFLTTRLWAGDDFYLNKNQEVAAGRGPDDVVLGFSGAKPIQGATP